MHTLRLKVLIGLSLSFFFTLTVILLGCGAADQDNGQSINNGMALYKTNCSACHQENGSGLAALYPPLKNSDYVKTNRAKLPCIIRNGLKGVIVVNGTSYDQYMPGIASLTPTEISDITNYVTNNFNQLGKYTSAAEVTQVLATCPQ